MATAHARPGYFCHLCQRDIVPNLETFTCPACNSGFIEALTENQTSNREAQREQTMGPEDVFDLLQHVLPMHDIFSLQNVDDDYDDEDDYYDDEDPPRGVRRSSRIASRIRPTSDRNVRESNVLRNRGHRGFRQIRLMNFGNPVFRLLAPFEHLQSDAGNYVFNQEMFDTIVTQLMNQVPNGPPPASDAAITALPRLQIDSAARARVFDRCSICFEEYTIGETLLQMPCQHAYHDSCIVTWLKQHGTCPVCRKDLSGRDTSCLEQTTPPGVEQDNTNSASARPGSSSSSTHRRSGDTGRGSSSGGGGSVNDTGASSSSSRYGRPGFS